MSRNNHTKYYIFHLYLGKIIWLLGYLPNSIIEFSALKLILAISCDIRLNVVLCVSLPGALPRPPWHHCPQSAAARSTVIVRLSCSSIACSSVMRPRTPRLHQQRPEDPYSAIYHIPTK